MSAVKKRTYELIYLLNRETSEEDVSKLQDRLGGVIRDFNGSVIKEEFWGKRRLAYEIKKGVNTHSKALYQYVVFMAEPSAIQEIERVLRITDSCIRFMNIRLDNFDPTASASPSASAEETATEENA
jgi:small subunit ribosomal protein S6